MTDGGALILGIESSCDDTAAALVDADGRVIASVVASQTDVHAAHGGVYPELASRAHTEAVLRVIDRALKDAGVAGPSLRAIGVTRGPGLIGSLLVGVNAAAALGLGWGVPVVGVNHLRGHLRSADLEERRVRYPAVVLLVSGGHSLLARMTAPDAITILGGTRDDSVGEAFDKVARMMGLGFPGGPAIDRLAATGAPVFALPRPLIHEGLEFSFSGLKSAVARLLETQPDAPHADVAASFVAACMDVLTVKCGRALKAWPDTQTLGIVGGVAANSQLRAASAAIAAEAGVTLCVPPLRWSTDNAAMIALAAWDYLALPAPPGPRAQARLRLDEV